MQDVFHNPMIESTRQNLRAEEFDCGHIKNKDDIKLFFRGWKLKDSEISPNTTIILQIHGMITHSEPYVRMADWLVDDNTILYGLDLQGHGHSEGDRGDFKDFMKFLDNIEDMLIDLKKKYPKAKFILSGESMGGLAVTLYLVTKALDKSTTPIEKALLWAPAYKTAPNTLDMKTLLSNILLPAYLIFNPGKPIVKSRHRNTLRREECAEFDRTDPITLHETSPRYLLNINNSMKKLKKVNAESIIQTPFCIIQGTDDRIIDQNATYEFYMNSAIKEKCKYIKVPDSWHCIYCDPAFNDEHVKLIRDFLS